MDERLKVKLKDLPKTPGVYFHKDKRGEIIYIGKAAVLNNRVRQYFQASRHRDAKTEALVAEITDTDWMEVDSELEALFLEAEMVRRYLPRYNILLRDDKSLIYIRIDYDSDYPTVTTTRRPLDDKAKYFGPYLSKHSILQALKYLRRVFPYAIQRSPGQKRASLHYHLGLDPGLEDGRTSLADYRANLRRLMAVIKGKQAQIIKQLEADMAIMAKKSKFEQAAKLRNQIYALKNLRKQVIFGDHEFMDINKDHALNQLVELFGLKFFPKRIEGYDISHMSGTDVVGSMVVFTNGVSDKTNYRKFKTKQDQNNDFENMSETLSRRLSTKNVNSWGIPDLILIDGGKGQLSAAIAARNRAGYANIPMIGLAKREEQIVLANSKPKYTGSNLLLNATILHKIDGYCEETIEYSLINLPQSAPLIKLLQRIRDESHRFAVSYHSSLKRKRQTKSLLDDAPGIGPKTKRTLINIFGSSENIKAASLADLEKTIGKAKAAKLSSYLDNLDSNSQR